MTLAEVFPYPTAGTPSPHMDGPRSRALCRRVRGAPGGCFQNARKSLALLDARGVPALYVEGYAVDGVLPCAVLHAWIEIDGPDGRTCIDPTASYAFRDPAEGELPPAERYGAAMMTAPEMRKLHGLLGLRRSDWGLSGLGVEDAPGPLRGAVLAARDAAERLILSRGGFVVPEDVIKAVYAELRGHLT